MVKEEHFDNLLRYSFGDRIVTKCDRGNKFSYVIIAHPWNEQLFQVVLKQRRHLELHKDKKGERKIQGLYMMIT